MSTKDSMERDKTEEPCHLEDEPEAQYRERV
jgi:hypothetical protein